LLFGKREKEKRKKKEKKRKEKKQGKDFRSTTSKPINSKK